MTEKEKQQKGMLYQANNPDKVWDEVLKLALAKIESSPYFIWVICF